MLVFFLLASNRKTVSNSFCWSEDVCRWISLFFQRKHILSQQNIYTHATELKHLCLLSMKLSNEQQIKINMLKVLFINWEIKSQIMIEYSIFCLFDFSTAHFFCTNWLYWLLSLSKIFDHMFDNSESVILFVIFQSTSMKINYELK